jgi:hypothetical protein
MNKNTKAKLTTKDRGNSTEEGLNAGADEVNRDVDGQQALILYLKYVNEVFDPFLLVDLVPICQVGHDCSAHAVHFGLDFVMDDLYIVGI